MSEVYGIILILSFKGLIILEFIEPDQINNSQNRGAMVVVIRYFCDHDRSHGVVVYIGLNTKTGFWARYSRVNVCPHWHSACISPRTRVQNAIRSSQNSKITTFYVLFFGHKFNEKLHRPLTSGVLPFLQLVEMYLIYYTFSLLALCL